jgi:hypothetical protein
MRRIARGFLATAMALGTATTFVLDNSARAQGAGAASAVTLAGHRAVYELRLASSRGKQSLESVHGRILYDFSGSVCEGYALNFRQVTELDSGEGKRTMSDLRATHWEDGAGKKFRFTTQNQLDGKELDSSEGSAEREGDSVAVTMTRPEPRRFEIGDAVFPSDHMRRIIEAARAGRALLEIATFDGSESGEKVYNSLAVIGQPIAAGERVPDDPAGRQEALKSLVRWPVTISYFDRGEQRGDQTPSYSISFELYENGIARAVKLDYGDFVLDGPLTSLEMKEAKPCN